jgi:hypothetical protein
MVDKTRAKLESDISSKVLVECYNKMQKRYGTSVALKSSIRLMVGIINTLKMRDETRKFVIPYLELLRKSLEKEGIEIVFIIKDPKKLR